MDIAIVMVCMFDRSWEAALDTVKSYGIKWVEPCAGGHVPKVHYDPSELARDGDALVRFKETLEKREIKVAAMGSYGNPLHPDPARSRQAHEDFVANCKVASALGVKVVTAISGVPAGGPHDRVPNWIINSIRPDLRNAYRWQWQVKTIPYWKDAAKIADDHGVRISLEPIGGDVVYNLQTYRRLREAVGPTIGCNVDASHLFWMGIDVVEMIKELGKDICYAHVKDVSINESMVRKEGLIPSTDFGDWHGRSWSVRALGYGHDTRFWADYLMAIRQAGYDGPVGIEIEDPYMTVKDSLEKSIALVRQVMPTEPAPNLDWLEETYRWNATPVE